MLKRRSTARSLPKDRTVHGIPVKKLAVGQYIASMEEIQDLPQKLLDALLQEGGSISDITRGTGQDLIGVLLRLLGTAPDLVLDLAVTYIETDRETLLALSPSELLDVLEAWWELNDLSDFFGRVWQKVKPMLEHYQTPKTGSSAG